MDNYRLHEQIGAGEYGKVFRSTRLSDGLTVAVKVIDVQKFNDTPKLLELCMQEIEVLQMLQSPYVVSFFELIKSPKCYYFVYECCTGGPLDKLLLLQGHFTEQKSLKIFYQLLQAFKELRQHSIVHRDLKPSNILIHNGMYKLADFGFCKPIKNDMTTTMLGSPIYMAPEVLRGLTYNSKADIWSLGAVLYELLVGKCPFEEKSIARLITAQDESDWSIPAHYHVSKQTITLLKSMLIKDPLKRCTWEYLFAIKLSSEGEWQADVDLYSEELKEPIKVRNFLQEIVNERCKIQFLCQTSNQVLEVQLSDKANIIAYLILLLAHHRGQAFLKVLKLENSDYEAHQKLLACLRCENEIKPLANNFEFTRLQDTIAKEIESLSQGIVEFRDGLNSLKPDLRDQHIIQETQPKNIVQQIHSYVNSIRSQNYLAFIDHKQDKDKHIVTHAVQVLDAVFVDKFMNNNIGKYHSKIDPTLDNYLEIRSMTKKQLNERFDNLQIL